MSVIEKASVVGFWFGLAMTLLAFINSRNLIESLLAGFVFFIVITVIAAIILAIKNAFEQT